MCHEMQAFKNHLYPKLFNFSHVFIVFNDIRHWCLLTFAYNFCFMFASKVDVIYFPVILSTHLVFLHNGYCHWQTPTMMLQQPFRLTAESPCIIYFLWGHFSRWLHSQSIFDFHFTCVLFTVVWKPAERPLLIEYSIDLFVFVWIS